MDMLTAIQTRSTLTQEDEVDHSRPGNVPEVSDWSLDSADDVLRALRSQPNQELLSCALQWLDPSRNKTFNIKIPGPKSAEILHVLVNEIIPSYWSILQNNDLKVASTKKEKVRLVRCLRNVAGIGAIFNRLRALISSATETSDSKNSNTNVLPMIHDLIVVLDGILNGDHVVKDFWLEANSQIPEIPKRRLMWRELVSFLASGKMNALVAEAEHLLRERASNDKGGSWLGDGNKYSAWLGRNIAQLQYTIPEQDPQGRKDLAQLLGRALSLGYTGAMWSPSFAAPCV